MKDKALRTDISLPLFWVVFFFFEIEQDMVVYV